MLEIEAEIGNDKLLKPLTLHPNKVPGKEYDFPYGIATSFSSFQEHKEECVLSL